MDKRPRFSDLSQAKARLSESEQTFELWRRTVGLVLGPLAFAVLMVAPPSGLRPAAAKLAAVLAWVLIWWITEAVPIPATALLGPALAVVCGATGAREMFAPFGDPVIFLFLGSFVIAEAMSVHGLDRRIAYAILASPWVGSSSARILLAFVAIAAVLSTWLSNAAATAMLYPIAIGVVVVLSRLLWRAGSGPEQLNRIRFGTSLMLACAYASSIGGIGTPIGAAPNLIAIGQLADLAGVRIEFFQWMAIAVPIVLALLGFAFVYLRAAFPPEAGEIKGGASYIVEERHALGEWQPGERNVMLAFGFTAFLWVIPGLATVVAGPGSALATTLSSLLPAGVVALLGAALLFVLPVNWRERRFTMSWSQVVRIDWGTLLLFGGGLALGEAMFRTGLAGALGGVLSRLTGAHSLVGLTFLFTVFAIYFSELTSETAAATMLVPLAIASARAAGASVVAPTIGCAIGCSTAFMLPVATPANAIVYGSGYVPIANMVRAGFWLNLAAAVIVPVGVLLMCRALGL